MDKLVFVSAGDDNEAEFVDASGEGVAIELGLLNDKGSCHSFFVFVGYVESEVGREVNALVDVADVEVVV
eukprot:scaffold5671_cov36-Cyclotella_meneghiniana.AAC.3